MMSKDTFKRYSKTWTDFIQEQGITAENPPDKEDFLEYISKKKEIGHGFNTLAPLPGGSLPWPWETR